MNTVQEYVEAVVNAEAAYNRRVEEEMEQALNAAAARGDLSAVRYLAGKIIEKLKKGEA